MESRNVSFFEHVFPYKSKRDGSSLSKRTFDQKQRNETKEIEKEPREAKGQG